MPKVLEHAHLDMRERVVIRKVVEAYRSGSTGFEASVRTLVGMGYERGSAERYVELLSSTCEHSHRAPPPRAEVPFWERRRTAW